MLVALAASPFRGRWRRAPRTRPHRRWTTTRPRLLGVRLGRTRLVGCSVAVVLLTATAVAAVGVIGFVGLVAPHAARALVGGRHVRVVPVAALLGALLSASPTRSAARSSPRPSSRPAC